MTNVIPFGKHTLEKLRARNRHAPAPPERPWPFNCFTHEGAIKPWPDKLVSLPPVAPSRIAGVILTPEEVFGFREQAELQDALNPPRRLRPNTLETEIENAIDRYTRTHPNVTLGQIILALVSICKDLAAALKLPSR